MAKRDYTALIEAGTVAVMEKLMENGHKPGFDNLDLYEEFEGLQDECTELFLELFKMNGERIPEEQRDYRKGRREAADVAAHAIMMVKAFDDKIKESGK
ncbi:hypothetical protein KAR91_67375 [Candidatus Pacearchaeota archaeon]|nr:hypothetical protein [Candidatus Pacearchaeota archaeon]